MKRQILKSFLSVLLVGIFLFLAFGSGESDTTSSSSTGSSAPSESSPSSLSSCPKCGVNTIKKHGEKCVMYVGKMERLLSVNTGIRAKKHALIVNDFYG